MTRRGWSRVVAVAIGVALVSLASNVTTVRQLSGHADTQAAVRFTLSKLLNAGAVWAGLAVLSGWLVRRPIQAAAAGTVACLLALVAHYGLGRLFGLFDPDVWASNKYWFIAAVVFGPLLGLVGATARRSDLLGVAARLVVPVGAILEPFAIGSFTTPAHMPATIPWPDTVSSVISGMILIAAGIVSGAAILVAARRQSIRAGSLADVPGIPQV